MDWVIFVGVLAKVGNNCLARGYLKKGEVLVLSYCLVGVMVEDVGGSGGVCLDFIIWRL